MALVKNPMLRARRAPSEAGGGAARVGPADDLAPDEGCVVADVVASLDIGPGSWEMRLVEDHDMIGGGVRAGVARPEQLPTAPHRSRLRSRTSGGSRSRPCRWLPSALCSRSGSRRARRRCPRRPGRSLVIAQRSHTCARTSATASAISARSLRVDLMESSGAASSPRRRSRTAPASARRCSISAQLSPPPASMRAAWTRTLPRSCKRRWPLRDAPDERASPRPNRSAKDPKCVQADVRHDTGPAGFHLHADGAGTVHFGSALLEGDTAASTQSVSLTKRAFSRLSRAQVMRPRE